MENSLHPATYASKDAPKSPSLVDEGIHGWKRLLADLAVADPETYEGRKFIVKRIGLGLGARLVSLSLFEGNEEHKVSKSKLVWSANQGCVSQLISQDEINQFWADMYVSRIKQDLKPHKEPKHMVNGFNLNDPVDDAFYHVALGIERDKQSQKRK